MLSPAFNAAPYFPITLLPALALSPLSQSATINDSFKLDRSYPRSPCTPHATSRPAVSAITASSHYFSPSNPFSARPPPGALSARHTIINTFAAAPSPSAPGTPAWRPDARGGGRTLRQRPQSEAAPPCTGVMADSRRGEEGVKGNTGRVKAVGQHVLGMAGWIILGMMVSLALLIIRAGIEANGGVAGGVGTVHIAWDTQAPAVDDVWAIPGMREEVAAAWASGLKHETAKAVGELKGIWAAS